MIQASLRSASYLLPAAVVLIVLLALLATARSNAERNAYFGEALSAAKAWETVIVGGKAFTIKDGQLAPESGRLGWYSIFRDGEIMRLAYAKTLARRNPLLALEGVDIPALESAIARLSAVKSSLAALQDDEQDREALLSGLYPTQFLTAAANAEKARRAFLADGSAARERQYNDALKKAIDAYATNLESYRAEYVSEVPDDFGYLTMAGIVTKQSTVRAIQLLEGVVAALRAEYSARDACTRGMTEYCDARTIRFPIPDTEPMPSGVLRDIPAPSREILGMLAEQDSANTHYSTVALTDSVCVPEVHRGAGYFVLKPRRTDSSFPASLFYVGDLFFSPITAPATDKRTMQGYMASLGISYQPYDPSKFYTCPGIAIDYSKAFGSAATAEFAKQHPGIDTHPALSGDVIYEDDMVRFIRTAAEGTSGTSPFLTQESADELTAIALGLRQNTFGFQHVVEQVGHVAEGEVRMHNAGVPILISPYRLLSTNSGFPSLFLAFSQDVPRGGLSLLNSLYITDTVPSDRITIRRWSDLRDTVSKTEAVRNLELFWRMHQPVENRQ